MQRKRRSSYGDATLKDHKRVRKQLLSPWNSLLQDARFHLTSWHLERLPEMVWINELIAYMGDFDSLELLTTLSKSAHSTFRPGDRGVNFLASSWRGMRPEKISFIRRELRTNAQALPLQHSLRVLLGFYPDYPVGVLVDHAERAAVQIDELEGFKLRLSSLVDRFEQPAVKLHAHSVISQIKAGILKLPAGMPIPDLNLLYSTQKAALESDEYEKAAGFVRSMTSSCFAMLEGIGPEYRVQSYFWNRGLELERCTLRRSI